MIWKVFCIAFSIVQDFADYAWVRGGTSGGACVR
jgi:hypothetical protein